MGSHHRIRSSQRAAYTKLPRHVHPYAVAAVDPTSLAPCSQHHRDHAPKRQATRAHHVHQTHHAHHVQQAQQVHQARQTVGSTPVGLGGSAPSACTTRDSVPTDTAAAAQDTRPRGRTLTHTSTHTYHPTNTPNPRAPSAKRAAASAVVWEEATCTHGLDFLDSALVTETVQVRVKVRVSAHPATTTRTSTTMPTSSCSTQTTPTAASMPSATSCNAATAPRPRQTCSRRAVQLYCRRMLEKGANPTLPPRPLLTAAATTVSAHGARASAERHTRSCGAHPCSWLEPEDVFNRLSNAAAVWHRRLTPPLPPTPAPPTPSFQPLRKLSDYCRRRDLLIDGFDDVPTPA